MAFTVDTTSFEKALTEAILHTSRDSVDVINHAAIEVITTAAKLTRKATPEKITAELTKGSVTVKASPSGRVYKKARHFASPTLAMYKIINARQKKKGEKCLNNAQMKVAGQKLLAQRRSACGYTAYLGWQKALLAIPGAKGFGHVDKRFAASTAAAGGGSPATVGHLIATFHNNAAAIEKIGGGEALEEALKLKEEAFIKHLSDKFDKNCKRASR